jgi:glycosyltransferase involved in cell wall biosynthesis
VRRGIEVTSAAIHADHLWFDLPGGVGTYLRNLVPALTARDPSLDLTLFHARFDRDALLDGPVGRLRIEPLADPIRSLYPRWNTLSRPALPATIRAADVLHAASGVAVPPAAPNQRLVVTIHDLAFLRFPALFPRRWRLVYRLGLRAAVRRADVILTPSRSTAEDLVSRTAVDPARIRVTPLAATLGTADGDPSATLARLGVRDPYVLFVGTLEPRKNLVTLVRAYRRAAAAGIPHSLVLGGAAGWGAKALERELALEGPGTIVRTGWLPDADLDAVYRAASLFVYPSLYEGFGLPVLEAMARGVPTIASTTSSLPEVTGDAALGVDPRSPAGLARAIGELATDQALAARLADAGRRRAEGFSWDETARLTLRAYEGSDVP